MNLKQVSPEEYATTRTEAEWRASAASALREVKRLQEKGLIRMAQIAADDAAKSLQYADMLRSA